MQLKYGQHITMSSFKTPRDLIMEYCKKQDSQGQMEQEDLNTLFQNMNICDDDMCDEVTQYFQALPDDSDDDEDGEDQLDSHHQLNKQFRHLKINSQPITPCNAIDTLDHDDLTPSDIEIENEAEQLYQSQKGCKNVKYKPKLSAKKQKPCMLGPELFLIQQGIAHYCPKAIYISNTESLKAMPIKEAMCHIINDTFPGENLGPKSNLKRKRNTKCVDTKKFKH